MASNEEKLEKRKLVQEVWTEHIKKELATMRVNKEFTANPYTIDIVTDKPTRHRPVLMADLIAHVDRVKRAEEHLDRQQDQDDPQQQEGRFRRLCHARYQTPKQKYDIPITTSHDIGWDYDQYQSSKTWSKPRGSTALTQYVQHYIMSQGVSPFVKSSPSPSP